LSKLLAPRRYQLLYWIKLILKFDIASISHLHHYFVDWASLRNWAKRRSCSSFTKVNIPFHSDMSPLPSCNNILSFYNSCFVPYSLRQHRRYTLCDVWDIPSANRRYKLVCNSAGEEPSINSGSLLVSFFFEISRMEWILFRLLRREFQLGLFCSLKLVLAVELVRML
jgi:hypothetical protein